MNRDCHIEFPMELTTDDGRVTVRCSEGVYAAWNTAVSCLATRSQAMLVAYLREAIVEALREARTPLEDCFAKLPHPERGIVVSLTAAEGEGLTSAPNAWLLFRATFEAIRAAYGD